MTAAQRATLELVLAELTGDMDERFYSKSEAADALRAALGTCGTCEHLGEEHQPKFGFCAAPLDWSPFAHRLMPLGERCTGYTPKEGA